MQFAGMGAQYRYPIGYDAYLMYVAMWAQRFLYETGQGELRPGRGGDRPAGLRPNPTTRAFKRTPLTVADYLAEPFVVEPFRADDCTVEVDGACAVVVTSLERARDLPHPPAVVASGAYRAGRRPGLDIGDHLLWADYSRNYTSWLREELFRHGRARPRRRRVRRDLRLFHQHRADGPGGARALRSGRVGRASSAAGPPGGAGRLPTNTHGGLLSEGYLHGMNTVAEAVLQVQGRGGDRQVDRHDVVAVTSGALMDGSALILTADR